MAWLSSTAWTTSDTPVLATVLNNIGLDIRTWGANVDAAGYGLTNLASISGASGALAITAAVTATKSGSAHQNVLAVANATAGVYGAAVLFQATDTVNPTPLNVARIVGVFNTNTYAAAQLSLQTATGSSTWQDVLLIKGSNVRLPLAPTYASNAAAISGGLVAGDVFVDSSGFLRRVF